MVATEVGNPVYMDFNPRQVPFLSSLSSPDEALVDGWRAPLAMPPVAINWAGLGNAVNVQLYNQAVLPPDTVGDVGLGVPSGSVMLEIGYDRTLVDAVPEDVDPAGP